MNSSIDRKLIEHILEEQRLMRIAIESLARSMEKITQMAQKEHAANKQQS